MIGFKDKLQFEMLLKPVLMAFATCHFSKVASTMFMVCSSSLQVSIVYDLLADFMQ